MAHYPPQTTNGYEEPDDSPDWQTLDPDEYQLIVFSNLTPQEAKDEMARRRRLAKSSPQQHEIPVLGE